MKCKKCGKESICSDFCRSHFIEYLEKKVIKTIRQYDLLKRDEKIAVAVSGGKDSTVILYILKKLGYDVTGLTVDAVIGNYTKTNLKNLRSVCKENEIKLREISFREEFGNSLCYIQSVLKSKGHNYSSCMICGVLRRHLLNKYAKELGFDVIVTGHNLDDEAQAFLMNIFRNDIKVAPRQGPITGLGKSSQFVKRVKPLFQCLEKEIKTYSKLMDFPVNYEACPCSTGAYRREFREFLDEFEKKHPSVKYNIINFFMSTIHTMKTDEEIEIGNCSLCGEPSSNDICKKCQILISLKDCKEECSC